LETTTLLALFDRLLNDKLTECRNEIELNLSHRSQKGPRGYPGQDFDFEENKSKIENIITSLVNSKREELSLKFSDLTEDEKQSISLKISDLSPGELKLLQGPSGARGKTGHGFDFEENKEDIENILCKIFESKSLSFEDSLAQIFEKEKESFRLKFSDLTLEDKREIVGERGEKGPRGQKGKPGHQGERGERGEKGDVGCVGARGNIGPQGLPGVQGFSGKRGNDGSDAAEIIEVKLNSKPRNKISFSFELTDGRYIETNDVLLPTVMNYLFSQKLGGGGGGSSLTTALFQGVELGEYDSVDFLSSFFDVSITDNKLDVDLDLSSLDSIFNTQIYDEGNLISANGRAINFIGNNIEATTLTTMSDWAALSDVTDLASYEVDNPGYIEVRFLKNKAIAFTGLNEIISASDFDIIEQTNSGIVTSISEFSQGSFLTINNNSVGSSDVDVTYQGVSPLTIAAGESKSIYYNGVEWRGA